MFLPRLALIAAERMVWHGIGEQADSLPPAAWLLPSQPDLRP